MENARTMNLYATDPRCIEEGRPVWIEVSPSGACRAGSFLKDDYQQYMNLDHLTNSLGVALDKYRCMSEMLLEDLEFF